MGPSDRISGKHSGRVSSSLRVYIREQKPHLRRCTGGLPQRCLIGVRGQGFRVRRKLRPLWRGDRRTQGEERARAARAAPAFRLCRSRSSSVRVCRAAPNKRRERCGDSDGKQREQTPQRGASRRKLAQEGQGSAAVLCGGRSLRRRKLKPAETSECCATCHRSGGRDGAPGQLPAFPSMHCR